ncbi:hypothetical protein [Streptomyces sp. SID8499]|uniref:hypothetical protein n=1 Tax=Streptomyces sp. SID8499 TaxID=2706106 RepID=UPI0013CD67A3|nr:hypothetical protein [Streptomyces sp. SID8499]NED31153.1 hypothetical protein [Streptomyces sp. SID8499]NED75441.1 hypothetical protein [Streptomyces sp. SID9944]
MNQQQILDLYDWQTGVCFRHPERGVTNTTVVGVIRPRSDAPREVRACSDCVIAMEDARRKAAARLGVEYEPGRAGGLLA